MTRSTHGLVEQAFRAESGRVLAGLIQWCGDFELAEDGFQDALLTALERWPLGQAPDNPAAWITRTAQRRIIDRLRRQKTYARKLDVLAAALQDQAGPEFLDEEAIPDERLKLIFTCCHPALKAEAQIALILRTLGGLTTAEIAAGFMTPVPTMAQRLVRAKRKISGAGIPFRVPPPDQLAERLEVVTTALYLIFNEGYRASDGPDLIRTDLCAEAIRLTSVLAQLLTNEPTLEEDPEVLGLLALMLLHDARRESRIGPDGELVLLEEQDRSLWNRTQIEKGTQILDGALAHRRPGPYQMQAAIAALHAEAPSPEATDWRQIALIYQKLIQHQPSPVVHLNFAVAVAMADGPQAGLGLLDEPHLAQELADYQFYHAARADLLRRLGRTESAVAAYQRALDLVQNRVERRYLERRLAECRRCKGNRRPT